MAKNNDKNLNDFHLADYWKDQTKEKYLESLKDYPLKLSGVKLYIIIILLIYSELSLTKLAKVMQKSKSTLVYHLDLLLKEEFIISENKKSSIDQKRGKYYRLHPDFLGKIDLNTDFLDALSLEEAERILLLRNTSMSSFSFKMMSDLMAKVSKFYEHFETFYKDKCTTENLNLRKKREILREHSIQYTIHSLTKEAYSEIREIMFEAGSKINKLLDDDSSDEKRTQRHPYLLFKTILPMRDILEFLPSIDEYD